MGRVCVLFIKTPLILTSDPRHLIQGRGPCEAICGGHTSLCYLIHQISIMEISFDVTSRKALDRPMYK